MPAHRALAAAAVAAPRRRRLGTLSAGLLLAAGTASLLGGCGFALRGPTPLPFQRLALAGFANRSAMAEALRAELPAGTRMVEAAPQADVVLTSLDDHLDRTAVASSTAGQVREFRLRVVLKFRLSLPNGQLLLPETELEQSRDFSYSESAALAKQTEEAVLLRGMRSDLARQVLRVLATAPARLLAPPPDAGSR